MSKESLVVAPPTTASIDPIAEARRQWIVHGWGDAAAGMAAVTTLVRAHQILVSRVEEALAPLDLTFARFEILRLLGFTRSGRLPMGKIGELLQVSPASVTSAVKRLERDGLLSRESHDEDSRMVLAVLLPRGRDVLQRATDLVNEVFSAIGIDETGIEQLLALLDRIRAWAGDPVGRVRLGGSQADGSG